MKSKLQYWEGMYTKPVESLPWEIVTPPQELKKFLAKHKALKGSALDIGCGSGNYSVFLAQKKFQVTGVDFSAKALAIARKRAKLKKLKIKFIRADANHLATKLKARYDFIFDYSLLHHISDAKVKSYAAQFKRLLKPGGYLMLVCYSDKDNFAQGKRSVQGKYGNTMYYRTRKEIETLYKSLEEVSYQKTKLGKRLQHFGHGFVFTK
jgi:2-polyprenyl-3-methyl-5-hydroxy-6-metoxy-1,4-benzoquinol methylase